MKAAAAAGVAGAIAALALGSGGGSGVAAAQIADNSFLMEEAYNQERGVVQHISTMLWDRSGGAWLYTFTQEWPLWGGGQTHQFSYTVPLERTGGSSSVTRFGDVALNYRYQLVAGARTAIAPRVSLLLPRTGSTGAQVALPASVLLTRRVVTHWNAGVTVGDATVYNLGVSAIWLARATFNVMLETVWSGAAGERGEWVASPAVRWAYNFRSGLQIVPGVGYAIGVGPSRGRDALVLYLSFEHAFRASGRRTAS